jgi:DNA (cytosine-5)-methyltransferase 1
VLDIILKEFQKLGYHTMHTMLDAVHYGTPQFRERVVIIGSRDNEKLFLPVPTHFQLHQEPNNRWKTLRQAIENLEKNCGPCGKFTPRLRAYLELVPEGGNWKSLPKEILPAAMGGAYESGGGKVGFYRRLSYDQPSPTLVTSPVQKATILCHPKFTRPLSVKEYASIQGFPDWWQVQGKAVDCYRQIGNAVPIPLGRAIGRTLLAIAEGNAEVVSKRTRGTSIHGKVLQIQNGGHNGRSC